MGEVMVRNCLSEVVSFWETKGSIYRLNGMLNFALKYPSKRKKGRVSGRGKEKRKNREREK